MPSYTFGQFNDSYKPIMDGVGVCAENYTRWLDSNYGRAVMIAPHVRGFEDTDSFQVLRFPAIGVPAIRPYLLGLPRLGRRFSRELKSIPFDLVHSHCPFVTGLLARRVSRRLGIPHVTTFHTKYREDVSRIVGSKRIVDTVVRRIVRFYESADEVWTPSEATAQTLRQYGYTGPLLVAPNGTDMRPPTPEERRDLHDKGQAIAGIGEREFVLLFVGQHRWEKNVRLIIDALAELVGLETRREFVALFVGEGPAATDMRKLCAERGLAAQTRFLGKIVERPVLQSVFARSDLFLFPSLYDNAPLVMREAAAFSVPSVVAEGSSAAEVVTDGENGFTTPNDAAAMARVLAGIMDDRRALARAGAGAVKTIYRSWESIVDWVHEQYLRLIETQRA